MHRGAFNPPRLVDDAFEDPRNGRAFERASRHLAVRLHVTEHLGLTLGLIDVEPERLLQLPDFERAMRALVQQLDQFFIELGLTEQEEKQIVPILKDEIKRLEALKRTLLSVACRSSSSCETSAPPSTRRSSRCLTQNNSRSSRKCAKRFGGCA